MGRKNPARRGMRPRTQVPGTGASVSHIRPEVEERTRAQQQHPSTGHYDDTTVEELKILKDDLKTLVIEAHGVLKDLRIESRQAKRIIPMIVSKRITAELEKQLAEMGSQVQEAMKASVDKVGREFDKLEKAFLGMDRSAKKAGKPSIPELVDLAREVEALAPVREIADAVDAYKYGPLDKDA